MSVLTCATCRTFFPVESAAVACVCGELLDVQLPAAPVERSLFDERRGLLGPLGRGWRFHELVAPVLAEEELHGLWEGDSPLRTDGRLARWTGVEELILKIEATNPTGQLLDRGVAAAVSVGIGLAAEVLIGVGGGALSHSLAQYAAAADHPCVILLAEGEGRQVASLRERGAHVLRVAAGLAEVEALAEQAAPALGGRLINARDPWFREGLKSAIFELLQDQGWAPADWLVLPEVVPGLVGAAHKALEEARGLGFIDELPHLLLVGAADSSAARLGGLLGGRPRLGVAGLRVERAIQATLGHRLGLSERERGEAALAVRSVGLGCDEAGAAALGGLRKARQAGIIGPGERAVVLITGLHREVPIEGEAPFSAVVPPDVEGLIAALNQ